ncbi:MAG: hypothetical protein ACKVS5_12340 [Parvularculaceae bacterium]
MSNASTTAPGDKPPVARFWSRRRALAAGGGLVALGAGVGVLMRGPRRAEGLPQAINIASARDIGEGFYLADGWVLTADDMRRLKAAP